LLRSITCTKVKRTTTNGIDSTLRGIDTERGEFFMKRDYEKFLCVIGKYEGIFIITKNRAMQY
ncbi:MAG: hypothetical protein ACLR2O_16255, partial [Coprococcus sp.]